MLSDLMISYFKENYGSKVITDDTTYFIIYDMYDDESMYIRHLFIAPTSRGKRSLQKVEKELIDAEDPEYIMIKLEKLNPRWDIMAYAYIRRQGYKILDDDDNQMRLYRKIR